MQKLVPTRLTLKFPLKTGQIKPLHTQTKPFREKFHSSSFRYSHGSSQSRGYTTPNANHLQIYLGLFRRANGNQARWSILALAFISPLQCLQCEELSNEDTLHPSSHTPIELDENEEEQTSFLSRFFHRLFNFLDDYIFEPISTTRRFLYLSCIFLPVLFTLPILLLEPTLWSSKAKKEHSEDRLTLWWYGFLVRQMERAGPTFIKVSKPLHTLRYI